MRDPVINIRTKAHVRDLIDEAAKVQGKNRTDFMLSASTERAQEVLLDQVFFKLESAAFMEFSAMIEAPFEPSEAFKKLMAKEPVWAKVPA